MVGVVGVKECFRDELAWNGELLPSSDPGVVAPSVSTSPSLTLSSGRLIIVHRGFLSSNRGCFFSQLSFQGTSQPVASKSLLNCSS